MSEFLLEMRDVTMEFPGVRALDGVTFQVRRGEIHALVGENGAGKSTLMKILGGVIPHGRHGGTVAVDGAAQSFAGVRDAERAGIAVLHQELSLVPATTVAENLFRGRERLRSPGVIDWHRTHRDAVAALERVGLRVHPETLAGELGVGERQLVEIARALAREARLLVLDEPTAALTESETEHLMGLLSDLRARGGTVIYISHRLREVARIADRVTVLRDGRSVATGAIADMPEGRIIRDMVGRDLAPSAAQGDRVPGDVALELEGWSVADPATGRLAVRDVSLRVRRGEIVGIAGLMGAGRTELATSVFGAWGRRTAGTLRLAGRVANLHNPREAIAHGVSLVTEDRRRQGLVLGMDVKGNCTLASLRLVARLGVLDHPGEARLAGRAVGELRTRTPSLEQPVGLLSGGNQQKVVLARWLLTQPAVLLLDEPTRGVDVGAKAEIHEIVRDLARRGVAVLMISSELPEVLALSDRVLVMRGGRIVADLPREQASEEQVMRHATGSAEPAGVA